MLFVPIQGTSLQYINETNKGKHQVTINTIISVISNFVIV